MFDEKKKQEMAAQPQQNSTNNSPKAVTTNMGGGGPISNNPPKAGTMPISGNTINRGRPIPNNPPQQIGPAQQLETYKQKLGYNPPPQNNFGGPVIPESGMRTHGINPNKYDIESRTASNNLSPENQARIDMLSRGELPQQPTQVAMGDLSSQSPQQDFPDLPDKSMPIPPQQTIGSQQTGGRFATLRNSLNSRTLENQQKAKAEQFLMQQAQQSATPQPIQQPAPQMDASGLPDKSLPISTTPQPAIDSQAGVNAMRGLMGGSSPQSPSIVSREEFDRRMAYTRPDQSGGLRTREVRPEESFQSQFRGISYDDYVNAGGQLSPEMRAQQRQRMIEAADKNKIETKPAVAPRLEAKPAPAKPVAKPAMVKPVKKPTKVLKYRKPKPKKKLNLT